MNTRCMRHTRVPATSNVFIRYGNEENCSLLLNNVRINANDPGPPKRIHLPTQGNLASIICKSRSSKWICKVDIQN